MSLEISIPGSFGSAIVFGHADADGHLATEQTRDYLVGRGLNVTTVVSSKTHNYRFWEKLPELDLCEYGLVVFVDIAFSFRDPGDSLARLLEVSDRDNQRQFVAIDHHPLLQPRDLRKNVELLEVADPYDCCLGMPDPDLMEVAALCDGSPTVVTPTPQLRRRAVGVKRAAADVKGVAGNGLLGLIRNRQWDFFEALADEDVNMHRSARGIRRLSSETSPLLEYARGYSPLEKTTSQPELSRLYQLWHEGRLVPQGFVSSTTG